MNVVPLPKKKDMAFLKCISFLKYSEILHFYKYISLELCGKPFTEYLILLMLYSSCLKSCLLKVLFTQCVSHYDYVYSYCKCHSKGLLNLVS